MATAEQSYLRGQLEQRRERLHTLVHEADGDAFLHRLLSEVDAALSRMDQGAFGVCEECKGKIEADRLLSDPLTGVCLECLSHEEQHLLENDLTLAGNIQRALLPNREAAVPGWKISFHYEPAGLVSGDYCDLIESPGGLLFLLGDVSGKGVAASMLMSHLNATFRSLAAANLSVDRMAEAANRIFCKSTLAGQYATLIVGRAAENGVVDFVSAGHLPLLHVQANGASAHGATGVPLGMFCDSRYSAHNLTLQPGESLLLYTDGLTEAQNASGEEYGLERITRLAAQSAALAPEKLLANCVADLLGYLGSAKRNDDLSLLALRRAV
jgi:sigma-B regulation protein RsbU (phosphoserine phosphatase)